MTSSRRASRLQERAQGSPQEEEQICNDTSYGRDGKAKTEKSPRWFVLNDSLKPTALVGSDSLSTVQARCLGGEGSHTVTIESPNHQFWRKSYRMQESGVPNSKQCDVKEIVPTLLHARHEDLVPVPTSRGHDKVSLQLLFVIIDDL